MNVRPDLLNLPGLRVLKVHETDNQYAIEVAIKAPTREPCCLIHDLAISRNGTKEMRFRDMPSHGKFVELVLQRQRYICGSCGKTTYDRVPDVDVNRRMTERLVRHIEKKAASKTFASVHQEVGLTEGTIRNVFKAYVERRLFNYQFETPVVIGVDEKHLNNAYRFIIGNVQRKTLLDILPGRELKDLHVYFSQMSDLDRIEVWCQDMFAPYKSLQRRHAPQAQLVVDKFHVLKLASDAVERIRRRANANLTKVDRRRLKRQRTLMLARVDRLDGRSRELMEEWFEMIPILRDAYEAKEGLFALYDCKTKADALRWHAAWQAQLSGPVKDDFDKIAATIKTWHDGVFGYFEHSYTNAYVESVNRLIGDIHRDGRGYDFHTLRAKALLSYGIHRTEKVKFVKSVIPDDAMGLIDMNDIFGFGLESRLPTNYGVSIEALLKLISTPEW